MPGRIVLGKRNAGEYGLFVSKPGVEVMSATEAQLLLSTNVQALQIVATGVISSPGIGSTVTVGFPAQPVTPFLWIVGGRNSGRVKTLTNSHFTLTPADGGTNWPGGTPTSNFYWSVLNVRYLL